MDLRGFSRTVLKTALRVSDAWCRVAMRGLSSRWRYLDSSRPGPDGGIATAVRVKNGQRVSGAGLASDCDEHATASGERFENTRIVRLKSDAPHCPRESELQEIAARAL